MFLTTKFLSKLKPIVRYTCVFHSTLVRGIGYWIGSNSTRIALKISTVVSLFFIDRDLSDKKVKSKICCHSRILLILLKLSLGQWFPLHLIPRLKVVWCIIILQAAAILDVFCHFHFSVCFLGISEDTSWHILKILFQMISISCFLRKYWKVVELMPSTI